MKESLLVKILKYFVYACAFVPLIIFNEYISPFHFGKVVVFRSLVEVMLALYLLLIWKDRSYLPRFNIITWSFLAFACAFSITSFTSVIPYASVWGSLERMGGVFTFWHYFIYFIIITSIFRSKEEWLTLFKIAIFVGTLSAFYGFGQKTNIEFFVGSGGRERIFGTIGNPALFAGYQILILFLALILWLYKRDKTHEKIIYGSALIFTTIAILMTAVRGSILGLGIGMLAFALLYFSAYRSKRAKKILLALIGLAIIFVVLALLLKNTSLVQDSRYLRRITDFSLRSYTVQTRFWAWQAGIKGWGENPKTIMLGWGPENFNIPFSKYFNPKFFQGPGSETLFDRAHNMFVEILVTMGLLGLVTYLTIFLVSIKVLWRKINENKDQILFGVGFISLLIAYAIHNSFIFDTSANFLTFFTILGFIHFIAQPRISDSKPKIIRINKVIYFFAAAVVITVASIFVYKINILPAKANYTTTRAIILGWNSDFNGAIKKYEEAIKYNVPGKYEIRNRFAQYVLEKTNSSKLTPEYEKVIHDAITEVGKNIDENPQDYLPLLYTSRLYIILGKEDPSSEYNDRALEMSLRALDIAPTFVRTYYEIGQAYLNKKDFDKAAEAFKKAAELNPDVGLSYWYWGVVEIERGNSKLGLEILENILEAKKYTPAEQDLNRLISIYLEQGNYPRVAWAYEILVSNYPDNAQYRASLAVSYARIGKIDEAVEQAKKAAEINSEFESEARSFIQSLGRSW